MNRAISALLALGMMLGTGLGTASAADDVTFGIEPKVNALRKINVSGRQRMLSQRMSMAVCMARAGVRSDWATSTAEGAGTEFADNLEALRNGSREMNMWGETRPEILEALAQVDALWESFAPLAQAGAKGTLDDAGFLALHHDNVPLLKTMNAAVGVIENALGEGLVHPDLKNTINMAGRLRMLTQKGRQGALHDPSGRGHGSGPRSVASHDSVV